MGDPNRGIYQKFIVTRTDGKSAPGEKHADCEYFVLDIHHDKHAKAALLAYAKSCKSEYPLLAHDVRAMAILTERPALETAVEPEPYKKCEIGNCCMQAITGSVFCEGHAPRKARFVVQPRPLYPGEPLPDTWPKCATCGEPIYLNHECSAANRGVK